MEGKPQTFSTTVSPDSFHWLEVTNTQSKLPGRFKIKSKPSTLKVYAADDKDDDQEDMNPLGKGDTDSFKDVRYYLVSNVGTTRQELQFTLQRALTLAASAALLLSFI